MDFTKNLLQRCWEVRSDQQTTNSTNLWSDGSENSGKEFSNISATATTTNNSNNNVTTNQLQQQQQPTEAFAIPQRNTNYRETYAIDPNFVSDSPKSSTIPTTSNVARPKSYLKELLDTPVEESPRFPNLLSRLLSEEKKKSSGSSGGSLSPATAVHQYSTSPPDPRYSTSPPVPQYSTSPGATNIARMIGDVSLTQNTPPKVRT